MVVAVRPRVPFPGHSGPLWGHSGGGVGVLAVGWGL